MFIPITTKARVLHALTERKKKTKRLKNPFVLENRRVKHRDTSGL